MGFTAYILTRSKKIKDLSCEFKNIEQRDVEIFISEILDKDKSFIVAHPEYRLSLFEYLKLVYFVRQKRNGHSVAAITGHKEFYGLDFFVNKNVLIPRPDTELLVETAVESLKSPPATQDRLRALRAGKVKSPIVLIDVGTGSGCIPISILKSLQQSDNLTIEPFATDISRSALRVAKKNAKKHGINIKFFHGNLLEPLLSVIPAKAGIQTIDGWIPGQARNDNYIIITANLPYLTEKQFQDEPSIWREPKKALVAKNNGLALYEELLTQIKSLFTIHNSLFTLLLEIDPSQSEAILKIIKQYLPNAKTETKTDLAGRDRLVIIKLSTL